MPTNLPHSNEPPLRTTVPVRLGQFTPKPVHALAFADLSRLWSIAHTVIGVPGVRGLRGRLKFVSSAVRHRAALFPFLHTGGALGRMLERRPETLGAVVWPYVCLSWNPSTRLDRIRDHWIAVEASVPSLNFPPDNERELLGLSDLMLGLRVVLDQPKWFMREGQAVLSLFMGETRVFSLAFTLRMEGGLTAYIGAIQGRNIEGALDTYRALTGALCGMRPRDLLVDLFRAFSTAIGVTRIYAVSDASRHHRDSYFGNVSKQFSLNYDEIWQERGGVSFSADFFELPVNPTRRSVDDVPSKKRSMYRKRYEMLERIETQLCIAVSELREHCADRISIAG